MRPRLLLRALPVAAAAVVLALLSGSSAGAVSGGPPAYVALGASESVGVQPMAGVAHGVPTDHGYANDVAAAEAVRWPGLRLVQLGCPGETSTTMLNGDDRCYADHLSQLAAAVAYLSHHDGVLVTIDIGFNDVRPCISSSGVDRACLIQALDTLRHNLATVIDTLRAAAPRALLIGLNKYDPFAARWFGGPVARESATDSVDAIGRFDDVVDSVYRAHGVPVANVAEAFEPERDSSSRSGLGALAHRTCQLTYMCDRPPLGPNLHPDDAGYRAIAAAITAVISGFTKSSSLP